MPQYLTLSSQDFVSPGTLIEITENEDEIESDLPGSKARVMITHGKAKADFED